MRVLAKFVMLVVTLTALAFVNAGVAAERKITVVSWGGATQMGEREAFWKPYSAETGVIINEDSWNGEFAKIQAMVQANNVTWDLVYAAYSDAVRGCEAGILTKIPKEVIGPPEDYIPGALQECGAATDVFAYVFAYNADKVPASWGNERPKTIFDVYDVKKFPGKRGFRQHPQRTLEQALMADGVPVNQVYKVLSSPGGIERALAKLSTIREHVIFWSRAAQVPQLLGDGEVVIATAPNSTMDLGIKSGKNFKIVWDHEIYGVNIPIIPKGPNAQEALKLLAYTQRPEVMARLTQYVPSSPVRYSALKLVDPKVLPNLPTAPQNMKDALLSDEEWWADHLQEALQKFNAWYAK